MMQNRHMGCKEQDCESKHYSQGYCNYHYQKSRKSGILEKVSTEVRTCSFENCQEKHKANGYCKKHSRQAKKGTLGVVVVKSEGCSVENCTSEHKSLGYCKLHYEQHRRGTLGKEKAKCQIEGCTKKHQAKNYCHMHYLQHKKGTLGKVQANITLCTHPNCENFQHDSSGYCSFHRNRFLKNQPMDMLFNTKNQYWIGNLEFEHVNRNKWARAIKLFLGDKCMICGWEEASCDTHHILPIKNGGTHILVNGIVLCPNHHRRAHENVFTAQELQIITNKKIAELTSEIEEVY